MRLAGTVRLALAAVVATVPVAASCHRDPAAPSLAVATADAYVGRWIVEDPTTAPLPLGLALARAGGDVSGRGVAGRVTYSGVAYDVTGTVGRAGLTLRPTDGGTRRLFVTLRRDGRLAVRLDDVSPVASSVPLDFVLRRDG